MAGLIVLVLPWLSPRIDAFVADIDLEQLESPYLMASVIDDKPVVSITVSVVVTTALLGLLHRPLKQNWDEAAPEDVLIVNHGLAQIGTSIHVVALIEPFDLGGTELKQIADPIAFTIRLDDGDAFEIAVDRNNNPIQVPTER